MREYERKVVGFYYVEGRILRGEVVVVRWGCGEVKKGMGVV